MTQLLLLPGAHLAPAELQAEFGPIPAAMVPLDGRPAFYAIAVPFARDGYQVVLAVHQQGALVSGYLERQPELAARTIDVGPTLSLGETVLAALDRLNELPSRLVVNGVDTWVGDPLPTGNVVCCRRQADVRRWTAFELTRDQRIAGVFGPHEEAPAIGDVRVFAGVFAFDQPAAFRCDLRRAVAAWVPGRVDPFHAAVAAYFNRLPPADKVFFPVRDWRDLGHAGTYYAARQQYSLCRRFGNRLPNDTIRGAARQSGGVRQPQAEPAWYRRLPGGLRHVAPREPGSDANPDTGLSAAELCRHPALSDVYLFGACKTAAWSGIFQAIHRVLDEMAAHRLVPAESGALERAMQEMYVERTRQRLQHLAGDARLARFWAGELAINGRPCLGAGRVLELLPAVARDLGLYSSRYFTIIHGDLCLSNIRYDRRRRRVRLTAPRGSFGPYDIYGDPRYDLARLCQSFAGDFEFLVHDRCDVGWRDDGFVCRPHTDRRHLAVKSQFHRWMLQHWAAEYPATQFIAGLLFLSMASLHADRLHIQQALLAQGLAICSERIAGLTAPALSAAKPLPAPGGAG